MGEGYIYKGEGQEISGGEKANVFEWRFSPIVFSKMPTRQTALWCLSLCALLGIRLKGISPALSGSDTSQGLRQRGTFAGKKL